MLYEPTDAEEIAPALVKVILSIVSPERRPTEEKALVPNE